FTSSLPHSHSSHIILTLCHAMLHTSFSYIFFFTHSATTDIYTLSLHDALPILHGSIHAPVEAVPGRTEPGAAGTRGMAILKSMRSEEHTSELQSHLNLVCRLLLEKKKIK